MRAPATGCENLCRVARGPSVRAGRLFAGHSEFWFLNPVYPRNNEMAKRAHA
jgi:hypothetical protein